MAESQEYKAKCYHEFGFGSYPDFRKKKLRKLYKGCSKQYKREIRRDLIYACTEAYWVFDKYGDFPRQLKAFRGKSYFAWLENWQKDAEKHFKKYFGKNMQKWEKRVCKKFLKDVKRACKAKCFEEDDKEFTELIKSNSGDLEIYYAEFIKNAEKRKKKNGVKGLNKWLKEDIDN